MTQNQQTEQWLDDTVNDLFMDFLYYDRKNDEQMSVEQLQELIKTGTISKEMMIEVFTKYIENNYD